MPMIMGKKHLSVEDKNKLVQFLMADLSSSSKPKRGKIKEAAELFGVHRKTVASLWSTAHKQIHEGKPICIKSGKLGVEIKKRQIFYIQKLKAIPYKERGTIRDLAKGMGVSSCTIVGWIKARLIRSHSNAIKPLLNDANKLNRIEYCLSQLVYDTALNKIKFNEMRNVIHIDEKWFFITNTSTKCYKSPQESDPYRSCKSKRYITKVMFLCAVARPQFGISGECVFDGKIGIFPFTEQVAALRNSKNRAKGTFETKNVKSITKQVTKACIINQVIPSIKQKWPAGASKNIIIQQDNAKPHIKNTDEDFRAVASSDGFNIELVCQPPNSPDTNINDLGWFRSIQSLQHKKKAHTVDDLVQNVSDSFEELTPTTLNKVFLSLQQCCIEMLKHSGHNDYALAHMGKDALILEGELPNVLEVDEMLVRDVIGYMEAHQGAFKSMYNYQPLKDSVGM